MQAVYERTARNIKAEQDRVMAWMRRNTTLTDEQIQAQLKNLASASFGSGHEIGFNEALHKANWSERRNRILSWITFVVTAALVGATWFMFSR